MDEPNVLITRGNYVESRHSVSFAVASVDGTILASAGDIGEPVFMRSSAKPLVCATIVACGVAEKFQFTSQEIAIIAGSHSGEPYHLRAVHSILEKIGLDESVLACGPHPPLHESSARALITRGEPPRSIHNNCSGKHAGMLALAVLRGYHVNGYLSREHPLQMEILNACAEMLGVLAEDMPVAVDGCGMPVFAASLSTAATFYAKLSDPTVFGDRWQPAISQVCQAMISHPEYVGGTGRFDTELMRTASPTIVCKIGAEGYHATCMVAKKAGLAVKVVDGSDRALAPFVIETLISEGVLVNGQLAGLERYQQPLILNHSRDVVGQVRVIARDGAARNTTEPLPNFQMLSDSGQQESTVRSLVTCELTKPTVCFSYAR